MRSTRCRLSLTELREIKRAPAEDVRLLQAVQDALWHVGQAHDRVGALINARQADALEVTTLRGAVIDLVLLTQRIARAADPNKRAELMVHVVRIGERAGCGTAGILRESMSEEKA